MHICLSNATVARPSVNAMVMVLFFFHFRCYKPHDFNFLYSKLSITKMCYKTKKNAEINKKTDQLVKYYKLLLVLHSFVYST